MSPRLRNLLMTSTALPWCALGAARRRAADRPQRGRRHRDRHRRRHHLGHRQPVDQQRDHQLEHVQHRDRRLGDLQSADSSSVTLNRVTGGLGPSVIYGTITANGRVFIINRDGMLFGRNAVINTAGFLATTNDISNADFMAGRMNFNIPGRGNASIVNLGTITAPAAASRRWSRPACAIPAPSPRNLGTVALASGNSFTLDMYGDKLIQLAVGDEIAAQVIDVATGKPLKSLVIKRRQAPRQWRPRRDHRGGRAPRRRFRSSTTRA